MQGTPQERFGLSIALLNTVKLAQIVEANGGKRVHRTKDLFTDCQSTKVVAFRGLVVSQKLIVATQVVQRCCHVGMPCSREFFPKRVGTQIQGLGILISSLNMIEYP